MAVSHSVLAGPFTSGGLVLGTVRLVLVGDVGHERIVRVGIGQQGADREEHLGDSERGRPLVLEDVQTDAAVGVNVGMVNLSDELELWRLEGVIRGEVDVQEEHTAGEGGVIGAHDSRLPVELIGLILGAGGAVRRWVLAQVDELFLNSLEGHFIQL